MGTPSELKSDPYRRFFCYTECMHCPNGDADLVSQTRKQKGLTVAYAQCPRCHGFWLDAFNANYLKTEDITRSPKIIPADVALPSRPACPICQELLTVYHGQNVPSNVAVWKCPNNHGYFFPEAELFAFKKAQETKLAYFKLWNIPLPSVASILLVSIVGIVTLGVIAGNLSQRQTTILQAQQVITYQQAFVADRSVTIAVTTNTKTTATIHIGDWQSIMETTDELLHTAFVSNLALGTYQYYFTFALGGKSLRSDTFSFIIQ